MPKCMRMYPTDLSSVKEKIALDHEKATFGPNFETIDVILRGVAHLQTFREFLPRTQTFGATRRDKEPTDLLIGNQIPTAQPQ